jgi:hypothetical protein
MTSGVDSHLLLNEIVSCLRSRYASLNDIHYEAAWTESWIHQRCFHAHRTLLEAAKCAMPNGAGWYVLAVDHGTPRELNQEEDNLVDRFRFSGLAVAQRPT